MDDKLYTERVKRRVRMLFKYMKRENWERVTQHYEDQARIYSGVAKVMRRKMEQEDD